MVCLCMYLCAHTCMWVVGAWPHPALWSESTVWWLPKESGETHSALCVCNLQSEPTASCSSFLPVHLFPVANTTDKIKRGLFWPMLLEVQGQIATPGGDLLAGRVLRKSNNTWQEMGCTCVHVSPDFSTSSHKATRFQSWCSTLMTLSRPSYLWSLRLYTP